MPNSDQIKSLAGFRWVRASEPFGEGISFLKEKERKGKLML